MTTMYPPGGATANPYIVSPPHRTSILAITSLVLGILSIFVCFFQVVGPLAIFVGVFALIAIARSDGTLAGKGLAVSGIITGLLSLILGLVMLFGTFFAVNQIGRYGQLVTDAQTKDETAVAAWLSSTAEGVADSPTLDAFADATDDSLGTFSRVTPGLGAFFMSLPKIERLNPSDLHTYQARGLTPIPIPAEFAKGPATLLVVVSQAEPMTGSAFGKVVNMAVIPEGSTKVIWLFDTAAALPTPPAPATPALPPNGP